VNAECQGNLSAYNFGHVRHRFGSPGVGCESARIGRIQICVQVEVVLAGAFQLSATSSAETMNSLLSCVYPRQLGVCVHSPLKEVYFCCCCCCTVEMIVRLFRVVSDYECPFADPLIARTAVDCGIGSPTVAIQIGWYSAARI
jgi:hypothetical protein